LLEEIVQERIAPLNTLAAEHAAELAAHRKRKGSPVDLRDTLIAGIALATGAALATMNLKHFKDLPIPVLNPFQR
jgi:predicted nucleic acid-binding protein